MTNNLFITFEGIDGSGKNTQVTKLVDAITNDENNFIGDKYSTFWLSREPTKKTSYGKKICAGIRTDEGVEGTTAAKLFVNDRKLHTHNFILPRLAEGDYALINRYDLSTLSYQLTQGIEFDKLYDMHGYKKDYGAIIPHLTLVFDLPVSEALKRKEKRRGVTEQFEEERFQEKLYDMQELAIEKLLAYQPEREILRINANQSIDEVTHEMIDKISSSKTVKENTHTVYGKNFVKNLKRQYLHNNLI